MKMKIVSSNIVERVYHVTEFMKLVKEITADYISQVAVMSDDEIKYDRSGWLKRYGDLNDEDEYEYDTAIHTIAIEIEQLRRFGKIIYDLPKKNIRFD